MPSRFRGASTRGSTIRSSARTFAIVAIVLMMGVWIVLPGPVALALAT
jgi:hypothetical protein